MTLHTSGSAMAVSILPALAPGIGGEVGEQDNGTYGDRAKYFGIEDERLANGFSTDLEHERDKDDR